MCVFVYEYIALACLFVYEHDVTCGVGNCFAAQFSKHSRVDDIMLLPDVLVHQDRGTFTRRRPLRVLHAHDFPTIVSG